MPRHGYVYFIGTRKEKEVKIGWTSDVGKRLSELQTGHPHDLHVVYAIPGTTDDELALQRRFAEFRLRGEWFRFVEDIHDFLTDLENTQIAIGCRSGNFDSSVGECLPYMPA